MVIDDPFHVKVSQYILDHQLFKKGDVLVLGVSGGMDSMALLHVFLSLRYRFGVQMIVAHLNHGLRNTAKRDQDFVRQYCQQHQVAFRTKSLPKLKKKPASIEDYARQKRLIFFQEVVDKNKAQAVVLAHHQDDVAETMLLQLLNGSGLAGLRGMLPNRVIDGLRIVRPMLNVSRKDVEDYINRHQVPFYEDETNEDIQIKRNCVRHQLIPFINQSFQTRVAPILARNATLIADDYDFLVGQAHEHFQQCLKKSTPKRVVFKKNVLSSFKPAMRRAVMRLAYCHCVARGARGWSEESLSAMEEVLQSSQEGFERHLSQHVIVSCPAKNELAVFVSD